MDRSLNKRTLFLLMLMATGSCLLLAFKCVRGNIESTLGPIPFPADNPMTAEKIELGRKLFFDKRLSTDNSISCADCHHPDKAFTDGLAVSNGVLGRFAERNAPSLLNSAYLERIMFDGELKTLEMQVIVPIQEHTEMGSDMRELLKELRAVPEYEAAAQRIFGRSFDPWVLTRSIAAFERSLISDNSAFDRFYSGDSTALTASQKRGWELFSQKLYCTQCHPAPHFTTYKVANNGLYADYGKDQGRFRIDFQESSKGLFKVPSLRNITLTAPYMHDGSILTLENVLQHYKTGAKNHVNQSPVVVKFDLTVQDEQDLLHFFQSLTDTTYLQNFQ